MASDVELLSRANAAYERGRRAWASKIALGVALLPAASCLLGSRPWVAAGLGGALVVATGLLVWLGRGLGRGAFVGLAAGLPGLALAHASQLTGHLCTGDGCYSLCVPACIVGGTVGGFMVARAVRRSPWPWATGAGAFTVAALTGAMGCSCVGHSGMIGLVAGLAFPLAMGALIPRRTA